MTQVDKAIEYLKKAADQQEYIEPLDMLRDIFGIERKIISEYHVIPVKKEIGVGDEVMIVGPSLGGGRDMVGHTIVVAEIDVTISGNKEFRTPCYRIFPESSVELV